MQDSLNPSVQETSFFTRHGGRGIVSVHLHFEKHYFIDIAKSSDQGGFIPLYIATKNWSLFSDAAHKDFSWPDRLLYP